MAQRVFFSALEVFEGDIVKIHPSICNGGKRLRWIFKGRPLLQHLPDAPGTGQRAGEHQKDIGDEHERVHDLQHIAEKCGEIAHAHAAHQDKFAAVPHNEHNDGVHDGLEGGQIQDSQPKGTVADSHKLLVDLIKLFRLKPAPDKGLDGPDGGQALLYLPVQMIYGLLLATVERADPVHDKRQKHAQYRRADDKYQRQPRIEKERQAHPHEEHDRTADQRTQSGIYRVLHDGDVGGQACDK